MAKKNPRLKKAGSVSEYTPEMIEELRRCKKDPIYFAKNYIWIKHAKRGKVKFNLYDYQEDMMNRYVNNRFNIILSARQTGKTETTCAYLLWFAIFHSDKTILVVSNKASNAKEMIGKIQYAYEELPEWLKPGIDDSSWNKHECKFDNKSRIIAQATSSDSGRGFAISLLYCDEFAFVRPHIQAEFWDSIYPTLSTGGSCIISSTPNGDSNLFAEMWRKALLRTGPNAVDSDDAPFVPLHVRWDQPPGRDEKFKRQQIAILGERKWGQEYECDFLSSDGGLMDSYAMGRVQDEVKVKVPEFVIKDNESNEEHRFFAKINPLSTYIIGIDPSTGSGLDYSVIQVFEFPSMLQVMEWRSNVMDAVLVYRMLKKIIHFIANTGAQVYYSAENNGVGQSIIALYMSDDNPPPGTFVNEEGKTKYGIVTSAKSKIRAALMMKKWIESGQMSLTSITLVNELKNYVRKAGSYQAQIGSTDDCIAAVLITLRIIEEIASHDAEAYHMTFQFEQPDQWEDTVHDVPQLGYTLPAEPIRG
jgi:hypothetical protein